MKNIVKQLLQIQKELNAIIDIPQEKLSWERKYDLVFSNNFSGKFRGLIRELNLSFDYYDPDSDYSDDVLAFIFAMNETMEEVKALAVVFGIENRD